MSILQTRSRINYRCYLVRPVGDFNPANWQHKPRRFTIIRRVGNTPSLGKADAWRFLQNHKYQELGKQAQRWAIWLPE